SVCVEQERIAGLERDGDRDARRIGELAQAERQAALVQADKLGTCRAEEQRRGMAAAEQLDLGAVRADLGEDGGDELLIAELAGQAGLDPGDDRFEAVLLVGSLAEHAEDGRGRLYRWQALALRGAPDP